jgi:hypothetical protein
MIANAKVVNLEYPAFVCSDMQQCAIFITLPAPWWPLYRFNFSKQVALFLPGIAHLFMPLPQ